MILEELKSWINKFMDHPGHQYDHVDRVYKTVKKIISKKKGLNEEELYISTILHDIARANEKKFRLKNPSLRKIVGYKEEDYGKCHAKIGAKWAINLLKYLEYEKDLEKIAYNINIHRFRKGIFPNTTEARILQECDKLDAIGAIGIIRTLIHYPTLDKEFYNINEPIPLNREIDDDEYALDHFYKKLFKLKDKITIPEIKEIANIRHEYMHIFVDQLMEEYNNHNRRGPVHTILEIIKSSSNIPIYDIDNPFNSYKLTLVSKLIKHKNEPFINGFLEQLKTEIL